jgi:hypothetical protein
VPLSLECPQQSVAYAFPSYTLSLSQGLTLRTNPVGDTYVDSMACTFLVDAGAGAKVVIDYASFATEAGYDFSGRLRRRR